MIQQLYKRGSTRNSLSGISETLEVQHFITKINLLRLPYQRFFFFPREINSIYIRDINHLHQQHCPDWHQQPLHFVPETQPEWNSRPPPNMEKGFLPTPLSHGTSLPEVTKCLPSQRYVPCIKRMKNMYKNNEE